MRRETDEATGEERLAVRTWVLVPVFDISQTEGPPLPEPPPLQPLAGDSHAYLLPVLEEQAGRAGYRVERRAEMPGGAQGLVDHRSRVIALSSALQPNDEVAVLVHELAHVHRARYREFGRAGAEVVAERRPTWHSRRRASTPARRPFLRRRLGRGRAEGPGGVRGGVHRIAAELEGALGLSAQPLERSLGIEADRMPRERAPASPERAAALARGR